MRVALLTDSASFAGTERHMLDLAGGLAEQGVEVTLCCPAHSALAERGRSAGHAVEAIEKRGRILDPAATRRLAALLRSRKIDLLHAHNSRTALAVVTAVLLAGRGHAVATQHFIEPGRFQNRFLSRWLRGFGHHFVNSRLHHVIAISRAVADAARHRSDVPSERLTVALNGIAEPAKSSASDGAAIRASLGISAEAPLVVCAARLEPEKDVATLIRAMRVVASVIPLVRCVITGDGSQRSLLEEQIKRAGLAGIVHLVGFRPDAPAIIAAGDMFALPSLAEPFGLVLLEAMALGKPIVATRAGGPTEIVVDRETGLLTPPAAPAALAAAIVALLRDPSRRAAMGRRGRERYETRFTADRMAGEIVAVYRRVLRLPEPAAESDGSPQTLTASS